MDLGHSSLGNEKLDFDTAIVEFLYNLSTLFMDMIFHEDTAMTSALNF